MNIKDLLARNKARKARRQAKMDELIARLLTDTDSDDNGGKAAFNMVQKKQVQSSRNYTSIMQGAYESSTEYDRRISKLY